MATDEPAPTLHHLGVSLHRQQAMVKAIQTGRLQDLPWAAIRPPIEVANGTVVDQRYEVEEPIGAGGFGGVFRAIDLLTERPVAVKVLSFLSPDVSRRMLQEIAVLRRLDLPCVVGFIDEGELDDHPYVVMPFLDGDRFPGTDHDGTWATLGPRALALAEALARVHAAGVLHRDIKPDNVLWVNGTPMLLDFGLAVSERLFFEEEEDLAGSPAYLAPEQYMGSAPTEQSDLFSLGVLLYESLSGELPFAGTGAMDVITHLLTQEAERLEERATVPTELADLVHQLLAKDPADRPTGAAEVVRRLRDLVPLPSELPVGMAGAHPEALEAYFEGPEVVHHLRSDPARVLWRRTGGASGAVRQSVGAWVRAGVATVAPDGRLSMERDAVDRLLAGMPVDPCRGVDRAAEGLSATLVGLWGLVDQLAPWATPERLAELVHGDASDVRSGLHTLADCGVVAEAPEDDPHRGSWFAIRTPPAATGMMVRRLHDTIAEVVPPDSNERLQHLVAAGRMADVARSSLVVARARREEGRLREAWVAARAGLIAERRMGAPDAELLHLAAELVLEGSMRHELAVVELEARRRGADDVAELCAAALAMMQGQDPSSRLEELDIAAPRLRRWVDQLMAFGMQRRGLAEHEAWLEARLDNLEEAQATAWLSRLRLRQGALLEAAELADRAVTLEGSRQLGGLLNAAGLWLEVGEFDRADALLDRADSLIEAQRTSGLEAYAFHLRRSARYRRGDPVGQHHDFRRALLRMDAAAFTNPSLFLEAAVAWRADDVESALVCWRSGMASRPQPVVGLMFEALGSLIGQAPSRGLVERSLRPSIPPGIQAQVCAAHVISGGSLTSGETARIRSDLGSLRYPRRARRELLSADEILESLEG